MRKKRINYKNKKGYNRSVYKIIKKTTKILRDKVSPNPFTKLDKYGIFGKTCGKVGIN